MVKFTPGPWSAIKYPDVKSWTVAAKESVASKIKSEVDARLIAASPDLLQALEIAREQLRQAWACIEHIKENAPDYEKKAATDLLKDIASVGQYADEAIYKAIGNN